MPTGKFSASARSEACHFPRIRTAALLGASLAALAILPACASAQQTFANAGASIGYQLSVDPSSGNYGPYLTVTNLGEDEDNLIVPYPESGHFQPFAASTLYNPAGNVIGSNYSSVGDYGATGDNEGGSSSLMTYPVGYAVASAGTEQELLFSNSGATAITIDSFTLAQTDAEISLSGNPPPSPYASLFAEAGVRDYDQTTGGNLISNPWVSVNGSTSRPITFSDSSDWTVMQANAYSAQLQFVIQPGQSNLLVFYADWETDAGLPDVNSLLAPTPSTALTLSIGLGGLMLRRRRRR